MSDDREIIKTTRTSSIKVDPSCPKCWQLIKRFPGVYFVKYY